jgi:hypothetical protein
MTDEPNNLCFCGRTKCLARIAEQVSQGLRVHGRLEELEGIIAPRFQELVPPSASPEPDPEN